MECSIKNITFRGQFTHIWLLGNSSSQYLWQGTSFYNLLKGIIHLQLLVPTDLHAVVFHAMDLWVTWQSKLSEINHVGLRSRACPTFGRTDSKPIDILTETVNRTWNVQKTRKRILNVFHYISIFVLTDLSLVKLFDRRGAAECVTVSARAILFPSVKLVHTH